MASPAPSRSVAIPILIVLLLATHVAAAFFLSRQGPPPAPSSWRIAFYSDFDRESEIVTEPGRPYRDFQVEYPPLVIVELKGLVGQSEADTLHRFAWTQLVLELAAIGALAWAWGEMVVLSYLVLTLPLVAFPYVFTRTDMLSVTLATLGMAAVKRRASSQGAGFLAISLFAKVWPIVLAPVLIVRRETRALAWWLALALAGGLAWVVWGGIDGPIQVLTFRHAHGWHIESLIGSIWHALTEASPVNSSGSARVGDAPVFATVLLGVAVVLVVARIWMLASRHANDERALFGVAPLAALAVLLVGSPLFSPQFVVWLMPWAAITAAAGPGRSRNHVALGGLTFAVAAATGISYFNYNPLLRHVTSAELLLVARNALVIAIAVVGWRILAARGADSTGEPVEVLSQRSGEVVAQAG
jgi:hypothetical protein